MTARVFHAHLWGKREDKYAALEERDVSTIKWTEVEPESPFYLFIPQDKELAGEYRQGWSLPDIFPANSVGIVTARDHFVIDFDKEALEARFRDFLDPRWSNEEVRARYFGHKSSGKYPSGDNRDWKMTDARKALQKDPAWKERISPCLYRPFDTRWILYHRKAIDFGRWEVMENMLESNLIISTTRSVEIGGFEHVLVSDGLITHHTVSIKEVNYAFPLYAHPASKAKQGDFLAAKEKQPNLAPEFVEALSERLGLAFDPASHRGLHTRSSSASSASPAVKLSWTTSQESEVGRPQGGSKTRGTMMSRVNPEDLFCYAYAVFHSPTYRQRYAEFLKIDFPRLPLTSDAKLFFKLADLGEELARLHLMRSPKLVNFITGFPHSGSNEVEKVMFRHCEPEAKQSGDCHVAPCGAPRNDRNVVIGNIWFNKDQCFSGVEEADWNFHIGGYQVLNKWLKDRKDRTLSFDDIEHYQKIIVAIHETRRLMAEIDAAIPDWPME